MHYFFVDGKFANPIPVGGIELDSLIKKHLERLKKEVQKDKILFTAPKKDNSGVIYVIKGKDFEEINEFIKLDPLYKKNIQNYKIIEFNIRDVNEKVYDWFK